MVITQSAYSWRPNRRLLDNKRLIHNKLLFLGIHLETFSLQPPSFRKVSILERALFFYQSIPQYFTIHFLSIFINRNKSTKSATILIIVIPILSSFLKSKHLQ